MALKRSSQPPKQARSTRSRSLMVRLDEESKNHLTRAAALRGISVSDYVRIVTVAQARREVESAGEQVIALTPEEQLAFWNALHRPVRLTEAQRQLGAMMRGDA
jgi:uncharacterized protein (DUF1778 family)